VQRFPHNDEAIRKFHPGPDGFGVGLQAPTIAQLEAELLALAIEEGLAESNQWIGGCSRKRELAITIVSRRGY
jgi:hypothetical protein